MKLYPPLYFLIIFPIMLSCQTRHRSENPMSGTPEEFRQTPGFTLLDLKKPEVSSADDLEIFRTHIGVFRGAQNEVEGIGHLELQTKGLEDYIKWQICPLDSNVACAQGETMDHDIFWGIMEPGPYRVIAKACIKKDNTSEFCGFSQVKRWEEPTRVNQANSLAIQRAFRLEDESRDIGKSFANLLKKSQTEVGACFKDTAHWSAKLKKEEADHFRNLLAMIYTQLANLNQLDISLSALLAAKAPLAKIEDEAVKKALKKKNLEPTKVDPNYTPGGFGLSENGLEILKPSDSPFRTPIHIYSALPFDAILSASTGLHDQKFQLTEDNKPPYALQTSNWEGLADWQRGTIIAGLFLGGWGGIIGLGQNSFHSGTYVFGALLSIQSKEYPCAALATFSKEAEILKNRLYDVQKALGDMEDAYIKGVGR